MSTLSASPISKPQVQLSGTGANVFSLLGKCTRALKSAGQAERASELTKAVFAAGSYDAALQLMMEYCDVR